MKYITATHFYQFLDCPTKVYLDFNGDFEEKGEVSDFMQKKFDDGNQLEEEILEPLDFEPIAFETLEEGFEATVKRMEDGSNIISQGVLIDGDLLGRPDLLEKRPGKSEFGDYIYVPADIKSGHSVKPEYIMQVSFTRANIVVIPSLYANNAPI